MLTVEKRERDEERDEEDVPEDGSSSDVPSAPSATKRAKATKNNVSSSSPLSSPSLCASAPITDSTSFTLMFADGSLILLNPAICAKSKLLQSFENNTPVLIDNHIHVSSAHALIAFSTSTEAVPDLSPDAFAMMLHLCDFLQMENDVIHRILTHLEPPSQEEEPLSRLQACQHQIKNFHIILFHFFHFQESKVNASPEDIRRVLDALVHSAPSAITYKDLNLCDGMLNRFTTTERQRREDSINNALATTAVKRTTLCSHIELQAASTTCEECCVELMAGCPEKWFHAKAIHGKDDIDLCGQHYDAMVELLKQRYACTEIQSITDLGGNDYGDPPEAGCDMNECMTTMLNKDKVVTVFFSAVSDAACDATCAAQLENTLAVHGLVLSHELLDLAMWKAIEKGRVDVAQCLLSMGAEPRLYRMPRLKPARNGTYLAPEGTEELGFTEELGAYLAPNRDIILTASHGEHERCHLRWYHWECDYQWDWKERNTLLDAPTSLMVATSNNDLDMMNFLMDSGCSANMLQPSFEYGGGFAYGQMDAVSQAQTPESMELLLSRGAIPDHGSIREHQYEEMYPKVRQLLHLSNERVFWDGHQWRNAKEDSEKEDSEEEDSGEEDSKVSSKEENEEGKQEVEEDTPDNYEWPANLLSATSNLNLTKLLCRYGADVNYMMMDSRNQNYNWEVDAEGDLLTFWPHVVATQPADIAWCRELLMQQNANPNWPAVGVPIPSTGLCINSSRDLSFNPSNACGVTVLLIAVMNDNVDLARLLLHRGADPNQYEIPDWSLDADDYPNYDADYSRKCLGSFAGGFCKQLNCPLSVAVTTGIAQMIQLLRENGATAEKKIDATTYWSLPGNHHPFS